MRRLAPALVGLAALGLAAAPVAAAAPGRTELFTFTDPAITESSGLVLLASGAASGLVVTTNDSGDTGRVFVVDPATGDTVGTTTWSDDPVDVEALAPAVRGSRVWVADIGDNNAVRSSVQVTRVPVARGDLDARGDVTTYTLVYADGARDAESLLVHPVTGRLVVMSKGLLGGYVYTAPERLDAGAENELEPVGTTIGIATDAAFLPDGRHLVVRDYSRAVVYTWPGLEQVARVDLPEQDQGEGIAVDGYRGVLVSSEGAGSPVWEVPWPADVRREVRPERGATTDPTASPEPAGSLLDDDPEAIGWDPLTSPWVWLVLGGTAAVVALSVATGRRRR